MSNNWMEWTETEVEKLQELKLIMDTPGRRKGIIEQYRKKYFPQRSYCSVQSALRKLREGKIVGNPRGRSTGNNFKHKNTPNGEETIVKYAGDKPLLWELELLSRSRADPKRFEHCLINCRIAASLMYETISGLQMKLKEYEPAYKEQIKERQMKEDDRMNEINNVLKKERDAALGLSDGGT